MIAVHQESNVRRTHVSPTARVRDGFRRSYVSRAAPPVSSRYPATLAGTPGNPARAQRSALWIDQARRALADFAGSTRRLLRRTATTGGPPVPRRHGRGICHAPPRL